MMSLEQLYWLKRTISVSSWRTQRKPEHECQDLSKQHIVMQHTLVETEDFAVVLATSDVEGYSNAIVRELEAV